SSDLAGVWRIHTRHRYFPELEEISARRHRPLHRGPGPWGADLTGTAGSDLEARPGDLLRRYPAGILARHRPAATQPSRQSDQRLLVRRRRRTLGTSGVVGVR